MGLKIGDKVEIVRGLASLGHFGTIITIDDELPGVPHYQVTTDVSTDWWREESLKKVEEKSPIQLTLIFYPADDPKYRKKIKKILKIMEDE